MQRGRGGSSQGREVVSERVRCRKGVKKRNKEGGMDGRSQGREVVSERVRCRKGVKKRKREGGIEGFREGVQCWRESEMQEGSEEKKQGGRDGRIQGRSALSERE